MTLSCAEYRGLFIAGTDTGVGKTVIGTMLVRAFTLLGVKVYPRKPVETACVEQDGQLRPADGSCYAEAVDYACSLESITPYRFKTAVSSERAARLEGFKLSISDLRQAIVNDVPKDGFIIAEGAGGLYSPITEDGNNADLAVALGFPTVLVVADRLGCLNHALLCLEVAKRRQIIVAAVVLNANEEQDNTGMDNFEDLKRHTSLPVIRFANINDSALAQAELLEVLAKLK